MVYDVLFSIFHYLVHIVQIKLLISYNKAEGYFNLKKKLEISLARMGCGNIMLIYSVFSKGFNMALGVYNG